MRSMSDVTEIITTEDDAGIRIDKVLSSYFPDMSRSRIAALIKDGKVCGENASVIKKPGYQVDADEKIFIEIPPDEEPDIEPEDLDLSILYEDEDILIIDKPKDMVVHPSAGHFEHTLVNGLLYHCKGNLSGINGVLRPGIVHRIDKDTTGSLIVCKSERAHIKIAEMLKEHSIEREYRAIVKGYLDNDEGTIDAPIGRDERNRLRMAINHKNGKEAVTHYRVIEKLNGYSYIACRLETGRTHQIRVHLSSIGHPVLGDEVYGGVNQKIKTNGQCLHAYSLRFPHPVTGEIVDVAAPIPLYFEKLLADLSLK